MQNQVAGAAAKAAAMVACLDVGTRARRAQALERLCVAHDVFARVEVALLSAARWCAPRPALWRRRYLCTGKFVRLLDGGGGSTPAAGGIHAAVRDLDPLAGPLPPGGDKRKPFACGHCGREARGRAAAKRAARIALFRRFLWRPATGRNPGKEAGSVGVVAGVGAASGRRRRHGANDPGACIKRLCCKRPVAITRAPPKSDSRGGGGGQAMPQTIKISTAVHRPPNKVRPRVGSPERDRIIAPNIWLVARVRLESWAICIAFLTNLILIP